jgi:hypothetical protein
MTVLAPFNIGQFNTMGWNGETFSQQSAGQLAIIYRQRNIYLNWTSVSAVNYYRIQVSLFPDFRTNFVDQWITASEYSFTDLQVNNQKRYWRWHPSIDGATKFEPWSEVGSYWLDTTLGYDVVLNRNEFAFVNENDSSDVYEFDLFPQYTIIPRNMYRIQDRNRLGEMLSEFLTVKEIITLVFDGDQYIEHQQLNEIKRFHNDIRTFFLACFKDGERGRPMPHVWKVEFSNDPTLTMIAAGRQDLLRGTLTLEEV